MSAIIAPTAVGVPALVALLIGLLAFVAAVGFVRARRMGRGEAGAQIGSRSGRGIWLQGLGFFLVAFGPMRLTLQAMSAAALGQAVVVALLVGTCIGLFLSATTAMGSNWSFAARTRRDHDLVTWGPFATIRHPIYTGLFAMLLAIAVAFGHWRGLILGLPLFAWGTWIRVAEEEALLHARFGRQYEAYAARVKRFLPGIF
ncbi:isoprenylcysteine carboxylmethyltransferase family protein [uncultured Sphingomonas sp.]|uniref:methyltransferase family protein n=1 Tax=uncultured Sphingomonas sp. TaxID=158754 RepID=UPI0025CED974|nr:isoprenylcysteine carboxylmethyltransferase family protein [uncultured Sphingomonas sp.]